MSKTTVLYATPDRGLLEPRDYCRYLQALADETQLRGWDALAESIRRDAIAVADRLLGIYRLK